MTDLGKGNSILLLPVTTMSRGAERHICARPKRSDPPMRMGFRTSMITAVSLLKGLRKALGERVRLTPHAYGPRTPRAEYGERMWF